MKRYNIIGDIHGRTSWKDLIIDDGVNIFVGDYFDPYDSINPEDLLSNFMDIIMFKTEHPETVILLGNHDYCTYYLMKERYSRYNGWHSMEFHEVLKENEEFINGFAFNIGNKYFITHAGVTTDWRNKRLSKDLNINDLDAVKKEINGMFGLYTPFSFEDNSDWSDCCGDAFQQSPLWIRPLSLVQANLWKDTDVVQVIGHTQIAHVHKEHNIVMVDVLGSVDQSFIIEEDEDGNYKEFIQTVDYQEGKINKTIVELC